jgi:alkanesulfonate monooxygenase SsuD/methylene tetrahydromethanopterin reductase-like flavin-dependent oxidoreductase (luciferase family)
MAVTERQPHATGFAIRDPFPWEDFAELARSGESLGYAAIFLPEIAARDTLAALTGLAGETTRLRLATGIVPMTSRAPALLGMAAATVQERSGGRLLLGLGTGPSSHGALGRLRELVRAMRRLLAEGRAELDGHGLDLSLVPDDPPPIWVAALGPAAVRAAGEVADGVLLNWCTPDRVERARRELAEGAEAAGRDPDEVAVGVYVRANLGRDAARGLGALQAAAGQYASYPAYARQFAAMGFAEDAERAAAAFRAGRPQDVPEHFVRELCLVGEETPARGRLEAYRDAGADLPVVYPAVAGNDRVAEAMKTLEVLAP